jgi:DNA-binding transcriptional regulator YdaS (Cro superfamily)
VLLNTQKAINEVCMSAILKAVEVTGGQTALAKLLGVKQSHIWNWINRRQQAPAKYIRAISNATNGLVSVDELLLDHENKNFLSITLGDFST